MTTTSCPFAVAATPAVLPPQPEPRPAARGAQRGQPAPRAHEQDLPCSSEARLRAQLALGCWPWTETPPETRQMPEHAGGRGGAQGLWRGHPDGGTDQQRSLRLLPLGPTWVFTG